ncbi:NAD(P)/FAD-dependent oxidoreductase [Thalassobacillus sp. CUG 92003]|uniref:NAD(P)/FAD-dependent oxidoreductase n=1 Tax=Thalassobacillus sp. CUG 92003 TaxID=2736641 RepID=UPI0015E75EAD|nr:NAD(P)/FAD-dependent oxidoreductase [Thalassobacillus sp. CUG 92003]
MYDLAIIGSGPAGASSALFAAKAGKNTVVFDNGKSITAKAWVENHYGVPEIEGPELLKTGQKQAQNFGAELKQEEVTLLEQHDDSYTLKTETSSYDAKHVLFATGMSAKLGEEFGLTVKEGDEPRVAKVIVTDDQGKTNKPNIWAAGTVANKSVHTIITSGDGAAVAINIISELNGERYVDHDILK